jgi:uncharacterized PurR-regulated membrane protein YhhQ (DUF165 family)
MTGDLVGGELPPASRLGWPRAIWLRLVVVAAYVASIVVANVASTHWPPLLIGTLVVPAGTVWAGLTLSLRDALHETVGGRGVWAAIGFGALVSWLLATPQIAFASVAAFTLSELLDALVYARLRTRSRLAALVGSNAVGLVVDSVLFVLLAFGTFTYVPGQILGKTAATAATALLWLAAPSIRRRRSVVRR